MRTSIIRIAAAAAVLLVTAGSARAATFYGCQKNSNGKLRKLTGGPPPTCNASTETAISWTNDPPVIPKSPLVAFAQFVNDPNSVVSFGGEGTTSATTNGGLPGFVFVTFTGTYPSTIDPSKVVLLTTSESMSFAVTNAYVSVATPTTIEVGVYTWTSSTLAAVSDTNFIAVFLTP